LKTRVGTINKKRETALRNKRRGKAYQTTLAELVQGMNIGTLGGEDVHHTKYSFEAKTRKKFTGENMMQQAEANCPGDKTPVVVVHVVGKRHPKDLVIMRFEDWVKPFLKDALGGPLNDGTMLKHFSRNGEHVSE